MSYESAIETSKEFDSKWLCRIWSYRPAYEMSDFLHGFFMLSASSDHEMMSEVQFLKDICDELRLIRGR